MIAGLALYFVMATAPHVHPPGEAIVHRAACPEHISGQCLEVAQNTGGSGGGGGNASAPVTVIIQQNTQGGTGGGGGSANQGSSPADNPVKAVKGKCVQGVARNDVLWLRSAASPKAGKVGSVPFNGCGVEVNHQSCVGNWCKVRFSGVSGWTNTGFLADR